jgi:tripartite-type tricarboxylate transporter receptor subunit TctC
MRAGIIRAAALLCRTVGGLTVGGLTVGGLMAGGLAATAPAATAAEATLANKTVSILVATSAGGGYDFYARLLARHMGPHLPGNPKIIVKNMPGPFALANYLSHIAPKDGTEFGILEYGTPFAALLTGTKTEFDAARFGWLGSLDQFTPIVVAWHQSGFAKVEDLFSRSMKVGGSGPGSSTAGYPYSLNAILGTKFTVINGYPGSAEMTLAMERGEIDGIASWCWTCLKSQKPQWLSEHSARVLLQLSVRPDAELAAQGIPTVMDLAKTDEQRQLLRILFAGVAMARPFTAPPDLAPERLAMLRRAFAETAREPALVAEAAKSGNTVVYVPPEEITDLLRAAYATDPALVTKLQAAFLGKY